MRSPVEETVAVRATARGAGGISLIEILGPRAPEVVGKYVRLGRPGEIVFGRIVDEVLARYLPGTATREPGVEISCHGGEEPVRAVLRTLGIREVDRSFVLDRAVAARRMDRIRAEALTYLPGARTARAASILADQAAGALSKAVARLKTPKALLAGAPLGCALVTPPRIAIVGSPNVGKSTLFNALVERDRALVAPQPGSTRDPVEEVIAIDGIPFSLIDTAGLAPTAGLLEQLSMDRTRQQIERADLVLLARDGPASMEERRFSEKASGRILEVRTKADLGKVAKAELGVCAPKGEGVDRLRKAILKEMGLQGRTRPGAPLVFTARQRAILEEGGRRLKQRLLWGK